MASTTSSLASTVQRERALKVGLRIWGAGSLVVFGTIFVGHVVRWSAGANNETPQWLVWGGLPGQGTLLLSGVYLVWAGYVLIASRRPDAYASFLDFTMWANMVHGLIMVPAALEMILHGKFAIDIPWVWALSAVVLLLRPVETVNSGQRDILADANLPRLLLPRERRGDGVC
jgi:hypothetical protein